MKTCNRCGETKESDLFPLAKQKKDGRAGHCRECDKQRKRESNARIKEIDPAGWTERSRKYSAAYKERHPERVQDQERARNLRLKYGITVEQYDAMLASQGGKCATCPAQPNGKRLAVDHDHGCCPGAASCGQCIRALLCSDCNTALGLLKEDESTINNLLNYVRGFK